MPPQFAHNPEDESCCVGWLAYHVGMHRKPDSLAAAEEGPVPDGTCGAALNGAKRCSAPVDVGAPVNLCTGHLLAAHEWVAHEFGVTDTLPSPCRACGSRLGVKYPSGWLCAICEWKVGDTPDDDAVADVRVDVVYYIRFGNRIKIGTSANPRRRLAGLRHDELLAFERGNRQVEQRRHAQFAEYRILRTEWFDINEALTRHIGVLGGGIDDPWSRYALWLSEYRALRG